MSTGRAMQLARQKSAGTVRRAAPFNLSSGAFATVRRTRSVNPAPLPRSRTISAASL